MLDIIIKNATIITMDDVCPIISNGFIGVRDGIIETMGESSPMLGGSDSQGNNPNMQAKRCIDAKGKIVMPGLINTHAHAAMCVMRGFADDYALNEWLFDRIFPVEARLTEEAIVAGVRLAVAEMLASGTTSFSDMYFCEPAAAELIVDTGIRASLCNAVIALDEAYCFENDRAVKETETLIRDYHGAANGRILADVAIHAEYTSPPPVWQKVSAIARKHGLVTQVHLSETCSEHDKCIERHSKTPTQILNQYGVFDTKSIAAHCVWVTEDDMDILAQKRVSVAHNPVSNLKLASGIANVNSLMRHGVRISLGTDGCASNNSHDLFEEIKLAALLAKGTTGDPTAVPAFTALKMATVNGAEAQGRDRLGQLKKGYEADIIMLDTSKPKLRPVYDPMGTVVYSANGNDVCMTMVQGRILYENGCWNSIDVEKAISEVERIALPLMLNRPI